MPAKSNAPNPAALSDGARELIAIRRSIDRIDKRLLGLLLKRSELAQQAAHIKIRQGIALWDETRVRTVLETRSAWARETGVDAKLVQDLFKLLIDFSMLIENRLIDQGGNGQ